MNFSGSKVMLLSDEIDYLVMTNSFKAKELCYVYKYMERTQMNSLEKREGVVLF